MFLFYSIHWKDLVDFLNGCKGNHLYCSSAKKWELLVDTNKLNDKEHQPLEAMKGWSMVLFPTGVAGRDRDACTAESVLSMSRVGELGADILTSEVLSRTANSCRKSTWKCTFCTDKPEQTEMECFVQFFNLTVSANILITTEKHVCLISLHYKNLTKSSPVLHVSSSFDKLQLGRKLGRNFRLISLKSWAMSQFVSATCL